MAASRDDIANVLALAELMDAQTGCGMDAALKNVMALMRGAPAPATEPQPEPAPPPTLADTQKPARRPYSDERFLAFLDRVHPGAEYTASEVCDRAGIIFPRWAKHPASLMRRHGWIDANGYREGCRIYLKPVVVADAAQ